MIVLLKTNEDTDELELCLAVEDGIKKKLTVIYRDPSKYDYVDMYDLADCREGPGNEKDNMCLICFNEGEEEAARMYPCDYVIVTDECAQRYGTKIGTWKKSKFKQANIPSATAFYLKDAKKQNIVLKHLIDEYKRHESEDDSEEDDE